MCGGMLSFKDSFQRLLDYTKIPLRSKDELDIVERTAAGLLKQHMLRFESAWDVAKLISSIIRCNLIASSTIDLGVLPLLGIRSCPAPSCHTLENLLRTQQFDYPLAGWLDSIRHEIQLLNKSNQNSDAVCVVLSLLNQWHRIEVTRPGPLRWLHVERCSLFVGRLLSGLSCEGAAPPVSMNHLCNTFSTCWVSNLMAFALRDDLQEQDAQLVVSLLIEALSSDAQEYSLKHFVLHGLQSELILQQWQQLRSTIVRQCRTALRNGRLKKQKVWVDVVKAELTGVFTNEPPFLSEIFYLPPNLSVTQCKALCKQLEQSKDYLADDINGDFSALLTLSRACHSFASHTGNHAYLEISEEDMSCVKTATALALHTGQTPVARELLCWAAASGHHPECLEWQSRLQAWEEGGAEMPTWPQLPPPTTHAMLFTEYLIELAPNLSASTALDAIATSSDVLKLRMVCEGSLHLGCRWGKELLQNHFAAPLLTKALAKVAHEFLNVGDAPMARVYLTMLGSCVAGCPTHDGLLLLLQVLCRLARVLSGSTCLLTVPYAGTAVYQQWVDLCNTLTTLLPSNPEATFQLRYTQWRRYQLGDAFNARQALYRPILQHHINAMQNEVDELNQERVSYFTAVFIRHRFPLDSAGLTVERLRVENGGSPGNSQEGRLESFMPYCVEQQSNLGSSEFESISESLCTIYQENREQLSRGTTSIANKIEIGLCSSESMTSEFAVVQQPLSISKLPSRCENNTNPEDVYSSINPGEIKTNLAAGQNTTKEMWWAQRHQLDAQGGQVVCDLEDAFGIARFFMIGELPRPLRLLLWPLSEQITSSIAELREYSPVGESQLQKISLLKQKCFVILQGLPFIAAEESNTTREVGNINNSSPFRAVSPTCVALYDPTHVADCHQSSAESCAACDRLLRNTSVALLDIVAKLWTEVATDAKDCFVDDAAAALGAWLALHRERLQGICTQVTQQALGHMHSYLVDYYGSKGESSKVSDLCGAINQDTHANLLELPREHLYLIVNNDLHHLPLEGMDVLRTQSCSRVPSLEYLHQFDLHGGIAPLEDCYSVDAAHFYIDSTAVASPEKFEALLQAHPEWTVDSGRREAPLRQPAVLLDGASSGPSPVLETLLQKGRSVYVYLGHKRGESEIPRSQLYNRLPFHRFPDVLLMGCSSARMAGNALFESYGMPWAYISAGAKSFIGCLWDVTDGEVDRLTRRFLRYSTKPKVKGVTSVLSVGEALSAARKACKLPFLSGMATVMYGVNRSFSSANQV